MFFCISAKIFTLNHVKFRRFTEQLNSGLTEGLFGHARNLTQKIPIWSIHIPYDP